MEEQRRRTAYHESGHAVLSYAKGLPLESTSISEVDDSLGRIIFDREPEHWRYVEGAKEIMFALIVISLAGVKAAEMGMGLPTEPNDPNTDFSLLGSDWHGTLGYLDELCGEDESRQEEVWERAEREAERVLRENWPAVDALAESLLEHETLDAQHLESILETAGCEHDDSAVMRGLFDQEHERLVGRRFELWGRYGRLTDGDAPVGKIEAVVEELRQVERRIEEVETILWPEGDNT